MDTKWNRTGETPGEGMEAFVAGELQKMEPGKRPGGRGKAAAGFLAFALGVSLTVSSLGNVCGRMVWERDLVPRFAGDWQETENFRMEVASVLKDFLTIGAGGELDIYTSSYWEDEAITEAVYGSSWGWGWGREAAQLQETEAGYGVVVTDDSAPAVPVPEGEQEPDAAYRNDKNVLYRIKASDGKVYSNCDFDTSFEKQSIQDYNFYLLFQNGRASIFKDGVELDVYGGGMYEGDSQWFVPGYENFPASEQLNGVAVSMAVRKTPVRYHSVDYKTGNSSYSSSMYYLARRVRESREFYGTQAALFAAGLLCLAVWFGLRRATEPVNRKIASWTVRVWTEVRFLLIAACLWCMLIQSNWLPEFVWRLREFMWWDGGSSSFSEVGTGLARLVFSNPPALLALVWLVWLIRNDHRYNPREVRRSLLRPFCGAVRKLFRALRARDLKRPVEKRLSRRAAIFVLMAVLLAGEMLSILINMTLIGYPSWLLWTIYLLPVLLLAGAAAALVRRELGLAKDLGRLADQVEAVRAGDLTTPLALPEDADLRKTADSLNDIQAGMKAALEEQTRSERMKVELISNVSHDLKTPLTSILSYAELLRQEEDLPPAAADYARIIDEKAQRLKGMVEDVFEVSKAAADQLPVHLERLDLSKLLRQTLADMDGVIQESPLTFRVELPEEPVMIVADGKRLYRVFQNLIDNALRYALEGSRVYLTLKTGRETAEAANTAQVSVRNTSRNELPAGVDFTARFVRGDASRTDGGSGLGLSIVRSFTEACGGSFRVETVADLFTAIATFPIVE